MSADEHDKEELVRAVERALPPEAPGSASGELRGLVERMLAARAEFLAAAAEFGTPQYVVDEGALRQQVARFDRAFRQDPGQPVHVHYALKANPTLTLVQLLKDAGVAADASSGIELELALGVGFGRIVCSGPAKLPAELALAVAHADRVTVHLDSLTELERLERTAALAGRQVRAGVRVSLDLHGLWTKFGIPLAELPEFVRQAARMRWVRLEGIQFHLSWNRTARPYVETLERLGPALREAVPPGGWRFLDAGGGFYPEDDEAAYPWLSPRARTRALLRGQPPDQPPADWDLRYRVQRVEPIESVAAKLLAAFRRHVVEAVGPMELWLEPGRYLANPAVHILLGVLDRKGSDIAITDGATQLLGWERLELEHVPLIDLTRPGLTQHRFRVYGSLCTPHDLWGYTCYGGPPQIGDVLVLPHQGAYVQTLAQRFIKPLAQVVLRGRDGGFRRVAPEETAADRYPLLRSA